MTTKEEIAKRYADKVKAALAPEVFAQMLDRNQHEPDGVCASGDFCDVGAIVEEVFSDLGLKLRGEDGTVSRDMAILHNDALDFAKDRYLTKREVLTSAQILKRATSPASLVAAAASGVSGWAAVVFEDTIVVAVNLEDEQTLTLDMMQKVGKALGTDLVTVTTGNPNPWSEDTPGPREHPRLFATLSLDQAEALILAHEVRTR